MYSASEVEKMFKSRLAEEEIKWREEGGHQPQKKTIWKMSGCRCCSRS
jgi:hypothetical protein